MSNSTDKTGCISHRANSRFFIIYEDYLQIAARVSYEHRHKLAAFWRILETKTNDRITYNEEAEKQGQPKLDMWVEISYSECVSRSLETFKSSSFQVAAAESERLGFSKSKPDKRPINPLDPQSPLEDYKEYLFLAGVMQSVINGEGCPPPIEINSPLLKSLSQRKEERKRQRAIKNNTPPIEINSPPVDNNSTPLLNSTPGAIEFNRKKYREGSLKDNKDTEEESNGEHTDTFAPSLPLGAHSLPDFITCFFCSLPMEIRCSHCGKRACSQHATTYDAGDIWCEACVWLAENTGKPPQVIDALSLSQSTDTESHSQENLPLSSTVTTRNEEGDTHAQPLPSVPAANHSDRGSGDVPSRHSQINSPGFTSPLDAPLVGSAAGSNATGREGRAGVAEDTARGIGSGSPGEADATGDTARGQVTEGEDHGHSADIHHRNADTRSLSHPGTRVLGDQGRAQREGEGTPARNVATGDHPAETQVEKVAHDLVGMDVPGYPRRLGNAAVPGGDTHHAAVDERHMVAPETGRDVATGQEEIDTLGRAWQSVDPEQTAPREDVPVVAASPLDTSTVEPGESGKGTLPVAPVPGQEGVKPARSRQSKAKPIPEGPPVMPAEDAPWCAETIVQICEARRGRRYPNGAKRKSDRERDVQLEYAKQLAEMPDIDREKLLKAASHQETRHDNWWMETNGYISPKQLVEKDRIHDRLDELERLERKKSLRLVSQNGSANGAEKPTNQPTTNIRELVRQREAARAAQVQ